jgi:hypothetical protein
MSVSSVTGTSFLNALRQDRHSAKPSNLRNPTAHYQINCLLGDPDIGFSPQDGCRHTGAEGTGGQSGDAGSGTNGTVGGAKLNQRPKRYHGTVALDATRAGRDAGRVAEEVIAHLSGLVGANVIVTLEIEATVPDGVPENVVRTVTENSRTLKFTSHGFEKE